MPKERDAASPDPRRVLRPGSDPRDPEMPVAQRILDLAVRLHDRLRPGGHDLLDAYAVPRSRAQTVPGLWCAEQTQTQVTRSGERLTPDVAVFHDASQTPEIRVVSGDGTVGVSVGAFDGGYVSLALDLPAPLHAGLGPGDTLEVTAEIDTVDGRMLPGGVVLRLNLDTGGAPLQMEQSPNACVGPLRGVFELDAFGDMVPEVRAAWIDVVFTDVSGAAVNLQDCRIVRAPMVPL